MHLLEEITLIATISVLVTLVLGRLKLPVIAGLVLSGALVGPKGFSLAHDPEAIEIIAEVGVVFLFLPLVWSFLSPGFATFFAKSLWVGFYR